MRRAKIVCTMGPAVESPENVARIIDAGMNMARLNLSHGSYDEHQARLDRVRAAALSAGKAVAILVDLQGPKIRLARLKMGRTNYRVEIFLQLQLTKCLALKNALGLPIKDCQEIANLEIEFSLMTVKSLLKY